MIWRLVSAIESIRFSTRRETKIQEISPSATISATVQIIERRISCATSSVSLTSRPTSTR